jgi:hypothetical protein
MASAMTLFVPKKGSKTRSSVATDIPVLMSDMANEYVLAGLYRSR